MDLIQEKVLRLPKKQMPLEEFRHSLTYMRLNGNDIKVLMRRMQKDGVIKIDRKVVRIKVKNKR